LKIMLENILKNVDLVEDSALVKDYHEQFN
jgi:hypothetical protein